MTSNPADVQDIVAAIESNLDYLQNHEYNPFEPDNQTQAFFVVCQLSKQLNYIFSERKTQAAEIERLRAALQQSRSAVEALEFIAVFAEVRSKDDSKTFARVNRGALRNIAAKATAALSQGSADA